MPAINKYAFILLGGALFCAPPSQAFPSRGVPTIEKLNEPLPSDQTKRTWEFMKHFTMPSAEVSYRNCEDANEKFRRYVLAYNNRIDRFLSGGKDQRKLKVDRIYFKRGLRGIVRDVGNHLRRYNAIGRGPAYTAQVSVDEKLCQARRISFELKALREGVTAVGRIYPDLTEAGPALASVNSAIEQLGDDQKMREHIEGNLKAALAEVRQKPALSQNPAWKKAFRTVFARSHPQHKIVRQNLRNSAWQIERHWLTGRPIKRTLFTSIASKSPSGKCYITKYVRRQMHNGGGYGADQFQRTSEVEILCKNI